jgi:hypothetical protein
MEAAGMKRESEVIGTVGQLRSQPPPARPVWTPWWLWLSVPIALLGISGSMAGILIPEIYANETAGWQTQAIGQDIANLVVLPVMLVLAVAAARGSVRALLAWAGTAVYAAYAYVIYAFAVHFGPLFLLYVAVLGLAVWALIGFFAGIDTTRMPTSPLGG